MMNKIAVLISVGALCVVTIIVLGYNEFVNKSDFRSEAVAYEIINEWNLPEELDEISGIDWIGGNKMACVQDEDGIIFIYNLSTSQVEKRIKFAAPGDYEDIRIVGDYAYVLRSDGEIFEIKDFLTQPITKRYSNFLTEDHNLESLAFDRNKNRLLLAIKDGELNDDSFKGVYQFPLASKDLKSIPVFRLDMADKILKERTVKLRQKLEPSAFTINPENNNFFILDGRGAQLIIADMEMKMEKRYVLDRKDFKQAEGISFANDGRLFISNEGKNGKATILEINLK